MLGRFGPLVVLVVLAVGSGWVLHSLEPELLRRVDSPGHVPDFFVENFTTTTMDERGFPKQRLRAEYMAHFPDTDTNEFTRPYLIMYRDGADPWHVKSERGWLSASGEVMFLLGRVLIWRNGPDGKLRMEIETEDLRVLPDSDYGETDKQVVITTPHSRSKGVGMRAYLDESRLELLSQVQTVYDRSAFLP